MKTLNYRPNLLLFNGRINIYIRALCWHYDVRALHTLELGRHNVNKVHVCKYLFCRWIIASLGDNLMFSLREKISTTQTPMFVITRYPSSVRRKFFTFRLLCNRGREFDETWQELSKNSTSNTKFRSVKQRWPPGLWITYIYKFSISFLQPPNGIRRNWQEASTQRHLPSLYFSDNIQFLTSTKWLVWLAWNLVRIK